MTTNGPKTATTTRKRGAGHARPNSGESSNSLSIITGINPQESMHSEPLKIIAEVDGIKIKSI
jgi:hypothetical protein